MKSAITAKAWQQRQYDDTQDTIVTRNDSVVYGNRILTESFFPLLILPHSLHAAAKEGEERLPAGEKNK